MLLRIEQEESTQLLVRTNKDSETKPVNRNSCERLSFVLTICVAAQEANRYVGMLGLCVVSLLHPLTDWLNSTDISLCA